ncbi:MAG: RtcB family protein [Candidatus Thermoplasmatota archaeon]|jgi:tRNA-splicing ligase RtcB
MKKIEEQGRKPILAWTEGVQVEPAAMEQLRNVAGLSFVWPHIAAMPDVHFGMGATVGSVVPTLDVIIPAAVGVDIGCGMQAVLTDMRKVDLPPLNALFDDIGARIPHGRSDNGQAKDVGAWRDAPEDVACEFAKLGDEPVDHPFALAQLGTLGTGNHFIEVSLDEMDRVWAVLHSGSRGPGNKVGTSYIKAAKEAMKRWRIELADPNLAYLPRGEPLFGQYLGAVNWAQKYAKANRRLMMARVLAALGNPKRVQEIDCHHNYVAEERHFGKTLFVTRKGAVSAKVGEWGIIPGSMGARSFIVQGKGNQSSLTSCSHGAGRAMSRTAARKRFTVADHIAATEGIVCDKSAGVLDETPGAYKDIDAVMAAQVDLVEIRHTLCQVVSVKGGEGEE